MLRCTCCQQWTVETVVLDRVRGSGPQPLIRVRHSGVTYGEYRSVEDAEKVLRAEGVFEHLEPA
jgi:hypothetical protein